MSEFKIEVGGLYDTRFWDKVKILRHININGMEKYRYLGVITYKDGSEGVDFFAYNGAAFQDDGHDIHIGFMYGMLYRCKKRQSEYLVVGNASRFDSKIDKPIMVACRYTGKVYFLDAEGKNEDIGIELIHSSGMVMQDERLS